MTILLHPIQVNKTSEGDKGTVNVKRIDKVSLFVDDTILYRKDPKGSTRNFLQLLSILDKVRGYKVNTQNLVVFLSTNGKHTEKEIRQTIPFTTASETKTNLGINLRK